MMLARRMTMSPAMKRKDPRSAAPVEPSMRELAEQYLARLRAHRADEKLLDAARRAVREVEEAAEREASCPASK